jgi:alkylhydroperoxidase family enzyme
VRNRFERKVRDLERRVLEQPGTLDAAVRRAVARGEGTPPDTAGYVEKVRNHAYRVTDSDIEALRSAGYSEDQIFELTVAAAQGAAASRLAAGLRAMEASSIPAEPSERSEG